MQCTHCPHDLDFLLAHGLRTVRVCKAGKGVIISITTDVDPEEIRTHPAETAAEAVGWAAEQVRR